MWAIWSFVKDAGAALFGGKAEAAELQEEALKKEIEGLGRDAKDVQVEGDTVRIRGTARTAEDQEKLIAAVGNGAGVAKVEANKPMLKHPDKIYPGQNLRIPQM